MTDLLQDLLVDRGSLVEVLDLDTSFPNTALALRFSGGVTLLLVDERDDTVVVADLADPDQLSQCLGKRQLGEAVAWLARLGANSDTTVGVSAVEPTRAPPWSAAIGGTVGWAWFLINNLGLRDGLQLEFIDEERRRTTVQLLAAACQFGVGVVTRPGSP